VAATLIAALAIWGYCRDGTHTSCLEGQGASGELVGQAIAASAGLVVAVIALICVMRRSYSIAYVAFLLAVASGVVWVALLSSASG